MTAQQLNGTEMSKVIRAELKEQITELSKQGIVPGLAVVLVGDDPASQIYVNRKAKTCDELGVYSEVHRLPAQTSQEDLLKLIEQLNEQATLHGILVQMPLPSQISEKAIIEAIAVEKDVDGFHPVNVGHLMIGDDALLPCTPAGVIEMLKRGGIEIAGKKAVVIGRSNIVGKPAAMLLLREHATVTVCHSRTENMADIVKDADIVVAAVGKAKFVPGSWIKPGAAVIDVGINRLEDGKICGDVDFESAAEVAGWISPVPKGVGPMTITMLMKNTVTAASRIHELQLRVD